MGIQIPKKMTNEESRLYASIVVSEREIAYHRAIIGGATLRLLKSLQK